MFGQRSDSIFRVADFIHQMIFQSLTGCVDLTGGEFANGAIIQLSTAGINHRNEAIEGVFHDGRPDLILLLSHFSKGIESILERSGDKRFRLQSDLLDQFGRVESRNDDSD